MDRRKWEDSFRQAGINSSDMYAMSQQEFERTVQFLVDSGLANQKSNPLRDPWAPIFKDMGIFGPDFYEMSDQQFQDQVQFLLETGIDPPNMDDSPTTPNNQGSGFTYDNDDHHHYPDNRPNRTVSGQIREEQNQEYIRVMNDMKRREMEENEKKEKEEKMRAIAEEQIKNKRERIYNEKKKMLLDLGNEPQNGVQICVQFPNGVRKSRKFDTSHLCDELFTFVAGQDELFDENKESIPFSLNQPGPPIEVGKTFQQIGITRRSLVNVVLDD